MMCGLLQYLGSFPAAGGEHAARVDTVTRRLHLMKQESGHAVPVLVVVALSGVKVCDPEDQSVRMSHALRRISYATCEAARALFAFVAREPRSEPAHQYCHAFETDSPDQRSAVQPRLAFLLSAFPKKCDTY
ncbi:unnamed protein product [Colias eurytheme]|nr:unnamed protein product [Colias eurytheme]